MQALLTPDSPRPAEAFARCRGFLAKRRRGALLLVSLLGREVSEDLVPLLAWFELLRELDAEGEPLGGVRRALDEVDTGPQRCAISVALRPVVGHGSLSLLELAAPALELERVRQASVFESRSALAAHARHLVEPEVRAILRVLRRDSERDQLLGLSLALGMQAVRWIETLPRDVARGRIHLPMDEVTEAGLNVFTLRDALLAREDLRGRRLVAGEVRWARSLFVKGWDLAPALGWRRGRVLAFLLRWCNASLNAVEAGDFRLSEEGVPSGILRTLACGLAATRSTASPFRGTSRT